MCSDVVGDAAKVVQDAASRGWEQFLHWRPQFEWRDVSESAVNEYLSSLPNKKEWQQACSQLKPPHP
eukprot:3256529-Karenia_brevis.AAC.1